MFYYSVGVNLYVYESERHLPMALSTNWRRGVVDEGEIGRAWEQRQRVLDTGGGMGAVETTLWLVASAEPGRP